MPLISYQAQSFPPAYGPNLVGTHNLTVDWSQVVWAALSVGKAQADVALHGEFSLFEMAYRVAIVFANLRQTDAGTLVRSAAYDGLDPSEKGAISYFLGLTMAKLLTHELLNIPWLLHLDVYRDALNVQLVGHSKPDLVGVNANNEWVVVEAKGRTNDFSQSTLEGAKLQSQQITTIGGLNPVLRVGALTYFSPCLTVALRDPEGPSKKARIPDIPLLKEQFKEEYYRPVSAWASTGRTGTRERVGRREFAVRTIGDFDVAIGIPVRPDRRRTATRPEVRDREFIGKDGVLVRLGELWSQENMRLEPQLRHR